MRTFLLSTDTHKSLIGITLVSYLSLSLLKPGKSNDEFFIHVVLSKELDGPLVYSSCTINVAMLLLKPSILNPVLYLRMDKNK